MSDFVIPLDRLGMNDVAQVGGKNASLGEMISNLTSAGVKVPGGFATTSYAFWQFLEHNSLKDKIAATLEALDPNDVKALQTAGKSIRDSILSAKLPQQLIDAVTTAFKELNHKGSLAVRSSATAEDLPDASFAGQQETILNVVGLESVLDNILVVYASLFNDRAISYRAHHKFEHMDVAISVGVQKMVRSDLASSGVMFTMDTESGFKDAVFVTASIGLGEMVVQGAVNPDEFYLYKPALKSGKHPILRKNLGTKQQKMIFADAGVQTVATTEAEQLQFCLTDDDLVKLGTYALEIEAHYGRPMDIEWAKDGETGELLIVQARPETVKSNESASDIQRYSLSARGEVLCEGRSIGQRIGAGKAKVLDSHTQMDMIGEGDVLVTDMTDPDWEPIMKKASAIVTNRGGRTCHAAIIARELGIPAVVGCNDATKSIKDGQEITVSCAEGDTGYVYEGKIDFSIDSVRVDKMPAIPFKIMMNVGNPDRAFAFSSIPNSGVGLARLEFIIQKMIGIHPQACLAGNNLPADVLAQMKPRVSAYDSARDFYVEKLREGIAMIAAAFAPNPVIIRMSDFKSNEYRNLIGGSEFEPVEENPMIGYRGASRYVSEQFADSFALECEAVKFVREQMGLDNVQIMIPFVRTVDEARKVIQVLEKNGLKRGEHGLQVQMMCELPSNALLADEFLELFDGFSIGSNDLTQLTLGLDRDSGLIAEQFDEQDPAVTKLLTMAISTAKAKGKYIGICGQGPSDKPELALWLAGQKIESISLNPDTVVQTWLQIAKAS